MSFKNTIQKWQKSYRSWQQKELAVAKKAQEKIKKEREEAKQKQELLKKEIHETKCVCQACGHTWFYGKSEKKEQDLNAMSNAGKAMACCTCSPLFLLVPDKKIVDLEKCPKCNSKAIKKETIIHNV